MVFWPFYPSNKLKMWWKYATVVPLTNLPSTLTSFMICWYIILYFDHKEHVWITILCCSPNVAKYTIHTTVMSWQSWFICIFHYCNGHCCLQFYFTRVNNVFAMLKNFMKCTMQVFFCLIIFVGFYDICDELFELVLFEILCIYFGPWNGYFRNPKMNWISC